MRKDTHKRSGPKAIYRVRNWVQYNAGLIARGDVTMWIDESLFASPLGAQAARGRGRPLVYTDAAIQGLPGLKQVFNLQPRALQGFAQSLRKLTWPALAVPNYATMSRRAQTLQVVLQTQNTDEPLHLVVDSTGLKLYGEGEWKVRQRGDSKRRTWRKAHLAMNVKTGQIHAALVTHQDMGDGQILPGLLEQIASGTPIEIVGGDGAYDTNECHAQIAARGATPSIPPREGATHWPQATPGAGWRNGAIDDIAENGRGKWKQTSGYSKRSLVENLMYRPRRLPALACGLARLARRPPRSPSVRACSIAWKLPRAMSHDQFLQQRLSSVSVSSPIGSRPNFQASRTLSAKVSKSARSLTCCGKPCGACELQDGRFGKEAEQLHTLFG